MTIYKGKIYLCTPKEKPELRNYLVFMNTKVKGYILGAVAAATYGMNPLFTLPLYKEGMNPDSVLFLQISVCHSHPGDYAQSER